MGRSICPNDWTHIGDGLCVAPPYYKYEGCPLLKSFRGWTASLKTKYSQQCHIQWPCDEEEIPPEFCEEFDLTRCPRQWMVKEDGSCLPPSDFLGPCAVAKQVKSLSDDEKIAWASSCGIEWPCVGEIVDEPAAQPRAAVHVNSRQIGPIDETGNIINVR